MVRNDCGKVMMHSRRVFVGIECKEDANLCSILRAVKCMHEHHIDKIILASVAADLVGAVNRPKAWLSFTYQRAEILSSLRSLDSWTFF